MVTSNNTPYICYFYTMIKRQKPPVFYPKKKPNQKPLLKTEPDNSNLRFTRFKGFLIVYKTYETASTNPRHRRSLQKSENIYVLVGYYNVVEQVGNNYSCK